MQVEKSGIIQHEVVNYVINDEIPINHRLELLARVALSHQELHEQTEKDKALFTEKVTVLTEEKKILEEKVVVLEEKNKHFSRELQNTSQELETVKNNTEIIVALAKTGSIVGSAALSTLVTVLFPPVGIPMLAITATAAVATGVSHAQDVAREKAIQEYSKKYNISKESATVLYDKETEIERARQERKSSKSIGDMPSGI